MSDNTPDLLDEQFPKAPGHPVIVVHLADKNYPRLTACGPALLPDALPQYNDYPRYQCQACFRMLVEEVEHE